MPEPEMKIEGREYVPITLSEEERDMILLEFIAAQERDLYCHTVNKDRYERLLTTLPEGPWRDRISQLLQETNERIFEVESIIKATIPQLPSEERIEAALNKMKERNERNA